MTKLTEKKVQQLKKLGRAFYGDDHFDFGFHQGKYDQYYWISHEAHTLDMEIRKDNKKWRLDLVNRNDANKRRVELYKTLKDLICLQNCVSKKWSYL